MPRPFNIVTKDLSMWAGLINPETRLRCSWSCMSTNGASMFSPGERQCCYVIILGLCLLVVVPGWHTKQIECTCCGQIDVRQSRSASWPTVGSCSLFSDKCCCFVHVCAKQTCRDLGHIRISSLQSKQLWSLIC